MENENAKAKQKQQPASTNYNTIDCLNVSALSDFRSIFDLLARKPQIARTKSAVFGFTFKDGFSKENKILILSSLLTTNE